MDASALDTIKSLLGDNADEKIKMAISALSSSAETDETNETNEISETPDITETLASAALPSSFDVNSVESLLQIKDIVENITNSGNDSRSNLLISLKPYMRESRQSSIDSAIKLLNLSKLSGLFLK